MRLGLKGTPHLLEGFTLRYKVDPVAAPYSSESDPGPMPQESPPRNLRT